MEILKKIEKIIGDEKKCEQCGSTEDVRLVKCSSSTGSPRFKKLCRKCALAEKIIKY